MAAPVTWWARHHWSSWAGNQWVAPMENAARAPTTTIHASA